MKISRRAFAAVPLVLTCLPRSGRASSLDWFDRWLSAFNDPGATVYPDFVTSHVPSLIPYLDEDLALREASGGFELLRRDTAGAQVTALVRDRNWDRVSKVVLTVGEGRIDDIAFAGASPPQPVPIARLSEGALAKQLRDKLADEVSAGRFSGVVRVIKGNHVVFEQACGARDVVGTPVTSATRFCLGSMGKMFTAVSVLQCVEQGRLKLSDTIANVLPDYPDTDLARRVTVAHLLTHTGGTGDFFGPEYERHAAELRTPADFIRRFGEREALFPPGARWGYSNFGFIILGAVVEQVSGLSWGAFQKTSIFDPAGMTATSPLARPEDTAVPLTGATRTGLKSLQFYTGLPAGGGYSTIDDLYRFAKALQSGKLLTAESLVQIMTARVAAGSRQWSAGFSLSTRNGAVCYGHGGSAPGVNGDFAVYPRSGYTVVVLSNRGHPHAANLADYIGNRLPSAD